MGLFGTKKQVRNGPGSFPQDTDDLVLDDTKDEQASFPALSTDLEVGDDDIPDNEVEAAIARAWFAKRRDDLIEQQIQQHQAMWRAGVEQESAVRGNGNLTRVSYNNSSRGLSSAVSIVSDKTPVASNRQDHPSTSKVPPASSKTTIKARQTLPIPNAITPIDECSLITVDSEVEDNNKLCKGSWFDHKTLRGKLFCLLILLLVVGVTAMVVVLAVSGSTTRTPTALPIMEPTLPPSDVIKMTPSPSGFFEITPSPTTQTPTETPSPTGAVDLEVTTRSPMKEDIDLGEGISPSSLPPTKLPTTVEPTEPPIPPITLPPSLSLVWQHTVFGSGTNASKFGHATALSLDGKVLAVGAPEETPPSTNTTRAGRVYVYERVEDTPEWRPRATIDGRREDDRTGTAVALNFDGSVLAFSDPSHNNKAGSVRAFQYNPVSGEYDIRRGQELSGDPNSSFGTVLELSRSGTALVVSSPVGVGKVIVYEYNNETNQWVQSGEPMVGATNNDSFGSAVALHEELGIMTVAVSAPRDAETRGFVQAYQLTAGIDEEWRSLGNMTSRALFAASFNVSSETVSFGYSLSLIRAQDKRFRLAIGAPSTVDPSTTADPATKLATGMVVVYELTGFTNWTLVGEPLFSGANGDRLGHSVKLYDEGNLLLAGAPGSRNGTGTVNFYRLQSDGYSQQEQRLLSNATSPAVGDSFGWSVDATIDNRNTMVLAVSSGAAGRPGYVGILEEV